MKTLYVIGNGFDRHHDINCSYDDFRIWLEEYHYDLFYKMDEIYGWCDSDWWSSFENNLGEIDVMDFAQRIAFENPVDLSSDHCDSMWNDAQIAVENQMTELYQTLQQCFEEWIANLNTPSASKKINIESNEAMFLVFNYTRTLEDLYAIPENKVLHIHGEAGKSEKLVIGHGVTEETLRGKYPTPHELYRQGKIDKEMVGSYDIHDEWAWNEAFHQVASRRKPVEDIIKQNISFFNGISNVQKVCVYGFSFSNVDMPYLKRIAEKARNAHWEISCFSKTDCKNANNFAFDNSIDNYTFVKLTDLR